MIQVGTAEKQKGICPRCKIYPMKVYKHRRGPYCIECTKEYNRSPRVQQQYRDWAKAHPESRAKTYRRYEERRPKRDVWRKEYESRPEVRQRTTDLRKKKYWSDPEQFRAQKRASLKRTAERVRLRKSLWQANRRGRPGKATAEKIAARVAYYGEQCWMCGGPWEHIDHVIPTSRGGSNWPANLRPACAKCNIRKGGRDYPSRHR